MKTKKQLAHDSGSQRGIIDELMQAFWKEHQYDYFSTVQIALYSYLLELARTREWIMPIKCHTTTTARILRVSAQSLISARNGLFKRGLIDFTKGNGNKETPLYHLILDPKEWNEKDDVELNAKLNEINNCRESKSKTEKTSNLEENTSDIFKDELNEKPLNLSSSNTKAESPFFIEVEPANSNGDNVKNSTITQPQSFNNTGIKTELPIEELEKRFLNDEQWLKSIEDSLSLSVKISVAEIKVQVSEFFRQQKNNGYTVREENDCRQHFYNWLRKVLGH